ncbi:MAG: hypothetical protein Q7S02_04430, partial [bacterium]|nr:hypothetical protein [bacterium]
MQEKLTDDVVKKGPETTKEITKATKDSLGTIDTFVPMLAAAGQALAVNFAVTLVSQTLQQQILNKGFFLGDLFKEDEEFSAPPSAREQQARTAYAELQRPRFVSSGDYDQLSEFASCDPSRRQPSTCVIDEGFAQAVRRVSSGKPMTVLEAMDANLLHGDWPLIAAGTAKDQDPNCAKGPPNGGYCASNLAKLRRARIVPIGWELAANHEANAAGRPVTLTEAVAAFHANGRDGSCGTNDAEESPFCGLIDPSWVLRYPIQQCRLRAPGELLLEPNTNVRAETCVDAPSCLEVDAEGKCVGGYGYCVREKNVWHLSGQSCPAQAASCRALTSREGEATAVLTSTVDRSVCTAENAGCRWYAASHDAPTSWDATDRRYFNRLVERCQESDEGCTELIATGVGRRNLIDNPSFERDVDGDGQPDGWSTRSTSGAGPGILYSTDGSNAANGERGVRVTYPPPGEDWAKYTVIASQNIPITGGKIYTFSAFAKRPAGSDGTQLRVLGKIRDAGNNEIATESIEGTCSKTDGGHVGGIALYVNPVGSGFEYASCWFVAPSGATAITGFSLISSGGGRPMWGDAIQIEEAQTPSTFHEGYDTNALRTYMKVAPADLRCYDVGGNGQLFATNDATTCGAYARGCTAADVGCERFTPTDGSGVVNGQYSDIDRCPASCVGYSAYREIESAFDRKDTFDYFIPATARQCSQEQAGCSEFTNLDALERGGESREYYTFLRRCEKPAETAGATYYTWEGSEEQGYQLRSFVLKRSVANNENSAPEVFGPAPTDCQPAYGKRIGEIGYDAEITPDCRAFYSQNGNINYRRLSRTVLVTDECVRYRVSHPLNTATCTAKGGTFSTTAGCIFKGHRQESMQCSAAVAGCRAYRGNTSGVVRTIVATDFEDGTMQGWRAGSISSESVNVGGHALHVAVNVDALYYLREVRTDITTSDACTAIGGVLGTPTGAKDAWVQSVTGTCAIPLLSPAGGTFEAIVVGKGTGKVWISIYNDRTPYPIGGAVTFGTAWQRFTLGSAIVANIAGLSILDRANMFLNLRMRDGTTDFDSVLLRETPQLTTVIKGSWATPAMCDRASIAENAPPLAQGMLGCRAYTTRANTTVTLRSFSRLCSDGVVGCTSFYDTKNSTDLNARTYSGSASSLDDVTVPADSIRYLVDDRTKYCAATAKGCRRFGQPTLDVAADRLGSTAIAGGWTDALFLDQPDRYEGAGRIICENPELFCEEYRGNDGSIFYFKDPVNRTCEFKENVLRNGVPFRGWFKTGTDPLESCDDRYLIGGSTYGIWRNADIAPSGSAMQYDGWVGMCDAGQDQCTEFVDPVDVALAYPSGKSYYARRNTVDFASCQGSVSQKEGCVVLQDQSDPSTRWSGESSFALSDIQQGIRVPAVDCDRNPGACKRCVVERKCRASDGHVQGSGRGEQADPGICLVDSDCDKSAGFVCRGGEVSDVCTTDPDCTGGAVCRQFGNNGNAVVKVQRDRACGQWLACVSSTEAQDFALNRTIEVCESIDLCESSVPDAGGSQALRCERWVRGEETEGKILTRELYKGRNRTWSGQDYGGYALVGAYQANDLAPVDVSITPGKVDTRLVRVD